MNKKDPGTPPSDVLNQDDADNSESEISYDGTPMENAVTIQIGQGSSTERAITMFNNAAVHTMLDYLSDGETLFPAQIYEAEEGFAARIFRERIQEMMRLRSQI